MPDSKNLNWVDDYGKDAESKSDVPDANVAPDLPAANDADGWQQYRQWISRAPAPRGRRVGIDPSLYTWKGYRNWTDQIKRSWLPDRDEDFDG